MVRQAHHQIRQAHYNPERSRGRPGQDGFISNETREKIGL